MAFGCGMVRSCSWLGAWRMRGKGRSAQLALRRLDCVLARTREQVLEDYEMLKKVTA